MVLNFLLTCNFFFATIVIFCNNILFAVLSLVCLIIISCIILFLLKVEFLSFILLLIYIGAILILFLFVIMMLQIKSQELKLNKNFIFSKINLIYTLLGFKVFFFLYFFNKKLCVSINVISYEYIILNDNNLFQMSLLMSNDAILFLSLFTQKFYVK